MAISRKIALRRLNGLNRRVLEHLDEHIPSLIQTYPETVPHWRHELDEWLREMTIMTKHVGRRTAAQWDATIAELRQRATELLGEEDED